MDLVSHVAFAAALYPDPWCLVGSVLPDLPAVRRLESPSVAYRLTHTGFAVLAAWSLYEPLGVGVLSHVVLDAVTHGQAFAPRPLYPFIRKPLWVTDEWEFWNRTHLRGLALVACAAVIRIGYLWSRAVP